MESNVPRVPDPGKPLSIFIVGIDRQECLAP